MRYLVEGPDGKRYTIEGPDNATAPLQDVKAQNEPSLLGVAKGFGNQIGDYLYGAGQIAGQQPAADTRPRQSESVSEKVGRAAVPVLAAAAAPVEGVASLATGAALGGGLAALDPIRDPENESRGVRAALGTALGALGPVAGGVVGRRIIPEVARLSAERSALIPGAEAAGFRTTPAMRTGDAGLVEKEAKLAKTSHGAPIVSGINRENAAALNRRLSEAAGVPADQITPDVLNRAQSGIDTLYAAANGKHVYVEPALAQSIQQTLAANPRAARTLARTNPDAYQAIFSPSGQLRGEDYVQVRKQLQDLKSRALNSSVDDYPTANTYQQVTDLLDRSADATANLPSTGAQVQNPLRAADIESLTTGRQRAKALYVLRDTTKGSFDVDPNKLGKAIEGWYRSSDPLAETATQITNIPGLKESIRAGNPNNVGAQVSGGSPFAIAPSYYGSGFGGPALLASSAGGGPAGAAAAGVGGVLSKLLMSGKGYSAPGYFGSSGRAFYGDPSRIRQILADVLRRGGQGAPVGAQQYLLDQGNQ